MSDSSRPLAADESPTGVKTSRLRGAELTGLTEQSATVPETADEYRLREYLSHLYGEGAAPMLSRRLLGMVRAASHSSEPPPSTALAGHSGVELTERDQLLITYGDSILADDCAPLTALKRFADSELQELFSAIHILPFFPFTSDDGFAVSDYTLVREDLGDWSHVQALAERFELMFDLVINHCSREHLWFADFVGSREPGRDFFFTVEAEDDVAEELSKVVRPRNTPLLTRVQTYDGVRHVWTTFSEDQVDLNFGNPDVLCLFVEVLLLYMQQGARYLRLDAIAFLWKRIGSRCSSLPETHMVVKVLRLLSDATDTPLRLLTETNVPHAENVSYFGNQDEAHLVYQFSLAPLLLYSYLFNDGTYLQRWAQNLSPPPDGCSYLNFIASHDGVGLRPLEGLVPEAQVLGLIERIRERGGFVTHRALPDGSEKAYELNCALFSAFGGEPDNVAAFLGAHQLLLAFQGIPAIYLHALFGTLNDRQAVERTGRTRSINRSQWQAQDLQRALADTDGHHQAVYQGLQQALGLRRLQPAFAPTAAQQLLPAPPGQLLMLRSSARQRLLIVASFLDVPQRWDLPAALTTVPLHDVLSDVLLEPATQLNIAPYQVFWLDIGTEVALGTGV